MDRKPAWYVLWNILVERGTMAEATLILTDEDLVFQDVACKTVRS